MAGRPQELTAQDARGSISDILAGQPFDAATIIESRRGSIRGNHYHRDTIRWTYLLNGKQYIVVAIGGTGFEAEFIAFRLPN